MRDTLPETPFEFLVRTYQDTAAPIEVRIAAAGALLPFMHSPLTPVDLPDDDDDDDSLSAPGLQ